MEHVNVRFGRRMDVVAVVVKVDEPELPACLAPGRRALAPTFDVEQVGVIVTTPRGSGRHRRILPRGQNIVIRWIK